MGSGNWLKTIIGGKKVKVEKSKTSKGSSASEKLAGKSREHNQNNNAKCKAARRTDGALDRPSEDVAATRIWAAFRAYMVEWNNGSETMEEIVARIRQTEEAAVKRERALAYAFSHQWRPNASQNQGFDASELGKANWGWSWKERWIAARPWESRVPSQSVTPKKGQSRPKSKAEKTVSPLGTQKSLPLKSGVPNQKAPGKPGRLSFPGAGKVSEQDSNPRTQELKVKKQDSSFLSKTESKL